ncbi:MAG TPA: SH3 domain-containing protein [Humisphaera sp.]|jgi:hypothetical protein|nr:SH3 domain-containing protein [Humisphaera sp.]
MKEPSVRNRKRLRRGVMAAVLATLAITASADQVTIHKALDVLADKNPFADSVESVPSETSLERLGTEGSWVKVKTPSGKIGYVTSDDIQSPLNLTGVAANNSADLAAASNAGRGLNDDSRDFAKQKNLTLNGLNAMVNTGKAVSRQDVREFGKAGNVGPAKYRNK